APAKFKGSSLLDQPDNAPSLKSLRHPRRSAFIIATLGAFDQIACLPIFEEASHREHREHRGRLWKDVDLEESPMKPRPLLSRRSRSSRRQFSVTARLTDITHQPTGFGASRLALF